VGGIFSAASVVLPALSDATAKAWEQKAPDASKKNVAIKHMGNTYFFIFMFKPPW
jgi:hypothetical protein